MGTRRYSAEFTLLSGEEEARIYETVQALLTAHVHNIWLYTDEAYEHLTILALGEEDPAFREHGDNIRFLRDKERYWKHVRQGEKITRDEFSHSFALHSITTEQGITKVYISCGISFRYTDQETESSSVDDFNVELVERDGTWYVASVLNRYNWFDGQYLGDSNFDVDALIAEYDRTAESGE